MLIALLILLGVSPVVVAAVLLVVLWHRRKVSRRPGVFRCVVRTVSTDPGTEPGRRSDIRSGHAEWVHDVLLVHVGLGRFRTRPLAAASPGGRLERVRPAEAKHLGEETAGLTVRLDDGAAVRVIAPVSATSLLAGPWVSTVLPPVVRQSAPAG